MHVERKIYERLFINSFVLEINKLNTLQILRFNKILCRLLQLKPLYQIIE